MRVMIGDRREGGERGVGGGGAQIGAHIWNENGPHAAAFPRVGGLLSTELMGHSLSSGTDLSAGDALTRVSTDSVDGCRSRKGVRNNAKQHR